MKCNFVDCKKKVNLFSNVECLCGHLYCNNHKLPFQHNCTKNSIIKLNEKENIRKNNPVIKSDVWNLDF
jgi:hypothetical protein